MKTLLKQLALIFVFGVMAGEKAFSAEARKQVNVLLIMADDLRDYGGVFTRGVVKTPNLDRLRARGVTFSHAYAQYPVCNPSRTSLLTGLRCEESGIVGNQTFFRDVLPEVVTFPQALRQGGWKTHAFGKILHSANTGEAQRETWLDVGKSWDLARTVPPDSPHRRGTFKKLAGDKLPWCEIGIVDGPDEKQPDGQTATRALNSIRELSATGKPWMVAAGFHRPHDPFHSPKKYFDLYPKEKLTLYREPQDATKPPPLAITGGWKEVFANFSDDERREFLRAYLAGVSFMDAQAGRLLDELDRKKLWENTLVIFMGDHGYHLGERDWWNKSTLFDRACRAPLVMAAPGVKGGTVYKGPVEFVDLYPTIADFCGITPPHRLPGKSLRPILKDPMKEHKPAAFSMVTRGERFGQSVRTQRWSYIRWSDGAQELYDREIDPEETRNIAKEKNKAATVEAMKEHLQTLPPWPRKRE